MQSDFRALRRRSIIRAVTLGLLVLLLGCSKESAQTQSDQTQGQLGNSNFPEQLADETARGDSSRIGQVQSVEDRLNQAVSLLEQGQLDSALEIVQRELVADPNQFQALQLAMAILGRKGCLLYTSPSPRDGLLSRMPSSA